MIYSVNKDIVEGKIHIYSQNVLLAKKKMLFFKNTPLKNIKWDIVWS